MTLFNRTRMLTVYKNEALYLKYNVFSTDMDTSPGSIIESCCGIIIWVGLWNARRHANDDYYVNYLYIIIGLAIWWLTGEFRLQFVVQPTVQEEKSNIQIDV